MSHLKEGKGFLNEARGYGTRSLGLLCREREHTQTNTQTDPNKCGHQYLELCASVNISSAQFTLSRYSPPLSVRGGVRAVSSPT